MTGGRLCGAAGWFNFRTFVLDCTTLSGAPTCFREVSLSFGQYQILCLHSGALGTLFHQIAHLLEWESLIYSTSPSKIGQYNPIKLSMEQAEECSALK